MFLQSRNQRLTHEVRVTFLAEVSSIMNARPLIHASSDPEDPIILTPATLLTQKHGNATSSPGKVGTASLYKRQWNQVQNLANEYSARLCTTYLCTLQRSRKWQMVKPDLTEGDFVLLKDEQAAHSQWPARIIVRTLHSSDGRVRKVEVKTTRNGTPTTFARHITQVGPLFLPCK